MDYVIGTPVLTQGGRRAGSVSRIVVFGAAGPVHAVVARVGMLGQREVLIGVENIELVEDDGIHLFFGKAQVNGLPYFVEQEYAAPPVGEPLPMGFSLGSVMVPQGYDLGVMPLLVDEQKHLDLGEQDIARGYSVRCTDGEVGVVRDLRVEDSSNRLETLIVESDDEALGLFKIPASSIAAIEGEVVTLSMTRSELMAGMPRS